MEPDEFTLERKRQSRKGVHTTSATSRTCNPTWREAMLLRALASRQSECTAQIRCVKSVLRLAPLSGPPGLGAWVKQGDALRAPNACHAERA
eukprot:scaffold303907_cov31-Tisochrysis_lutea.AAC.1